MTLLQFWPGRTLSDERYKFFFIWKDSCQLYGEFKNIFESCTSGDFSSASKETTNYGFGWSNFNDSYIPPKGYQSVYNSFQYQDADQLQGSSIQGKYDTYDGSGYVYEMRGQLSYVQGNLSLLREMNWIDKQTRAVFVEFSTYNPNINLIMVSTILVEFTSTGTILATARFDPLNLFNDSTTGNMAILKTICEILFYAFIVYLAIVQLIDMANMSLTKYLGNFWI